MFTDGFPASSVNDLPNTLCLEPGKESFGSPNDIRWLTLSEWSKMVTQAFLIKYRESDLIDSLPTLFHKHKPEAPQTDVELEANINYTLILAL